MVDKNKALIVFQDKKIRRAWHDNEWYFSVIDVVEALVDSGRGRKYWSDLKTKLISEGFEVSEKIGRLKIMAEDSKLRFTDCANTKNMFRIIQSIPSKKAEPFKQWLAQIGHERIQEIENPELGQNRIKKYYELKGYPKDWIDKRLRGIAIRQDLTDEWQNRDVKNKDFGILTNEISKATFGKTIQEYKEFKNVQRKTQNLRDHMNDWELIFTMLGEKATTDITVARDSVGLNECKDSAKDGGEIASNARKELEQKTGKSILSKQNYLKIARKKKLKD